MNWKALYRFLVRVRGVLNGWISYSRGRAFPKLANHKPEQRDTENQPVLP